jgi:hypothetical protein
MERCIGVKEIKAKPMTRQEYNDYRGWELPADENGADEGYLVEYLDGGQTNHPGHDGYISWSPEGVFGRAYRPVSGMPFGLAIEALKRGHRVARAGWNGKDMWIAYMDGMELPPYSAQDTNRKVNDRTAKWIGEDTPLITLPYIAMWTADKKWLPGWLASQTDMLAEDWMIVE